MPVMVPGSGISFSPQVTGSERDWEGKRALPSSTLFLVKTPGGPEKYLPPCLKHIPWVNAPVYSQGINYFRKIRGRPGPN